MRCESVQSALVDGRPLSTVDDGHVAGCAACARMVATFGAWQAPPLPDRHAPAAPSVAALHRGVRGQRLREVGFAAAAVLLVGLTLPLGSAPTAPSSAVAVTADTAAEGQDDPLLVAGEVLAAALPESEADEALLLALVSLDRMDADLLTTLGDF